MIEDVYGSNGMHLAMIIRRNASAPGVSFLTDPAESLQIGLIKHPIGTLIEPHFHNAVPRTTTQCREVLAIKKGVLHVNLYNNQMQLQQMRILEAGDVILLMDGGHGFVVLEEVEMIEIKQGPYVGNLDKTRFVPQKEEECKLTSD